MRFLRIVQRKFANQHTFPKHGLDTGIPWAKNMDRFLGGAVMSQTLSWSLIAWGGVTAVLVITMIYRSLVSMKEEDQLFLDPAESKLQAEQEEILHRIQRIDPYAKGLGVASAGLLLVSGGVFMYEALSRF